LARVVGHKGFTLIEILVAILLFSFGALALARMQLVNAKATNFGKEAMVATTAAQARMELLKDRQITTFATVLAGGGPVAVPSIQGMRIQWVAAAPIGAAPNRYVTVRVTVTWRGQTFVDYSTIVSEI
jgi:prepilin-type N-terminal cleavage/methylation domain-containing protein